ncbi:DUF4174 domain-containing protein [Paracoccus sp. 1_MG-2023]|uniref:DUF4174 domain-containing protein n=1 Tax=unclassified Paracoccus (in: a-proteobacteria) TaxID=2688777 RepID=UPI001C08F2F1|nr:MULTISPECIES: DUF4174 domain-containing protein [unclassified Paracoccus (in: a-proteobacteria)]MBU2956719.1 DUF4174 domain-containing protein [Paracoccus sp. C2R09]MDO6669241.1 DUF4174 domain-containing protein [Paracoccus sp. 1_MG-2023]
MKLIFLIFAMAVAAMGPSQEGPVPEAGASRDSVPQRNPARLPPISEADDAGSRPPEEELRFLDAGEAERADFLWNARPVVVFAETPGDPAFVEQLEALRSDARQLVDRDVVVVTDSDPAANSSWRQELRPRGFSLVLIDKDGQVKIRRPSPWDVREIGRAIDRLPLRRQEIGRGRPLR